MREARIPTLSDSNLEQETTGCYHIETVLRMIYSVYIMEVILWSQQRFFGSGRSQAVRLPKEFGFNGSEVFVKRIGKAVVLLPTDDAWDSLAQSLDLFSDDFMDERNQSQEQQREEPF